MAQKQQKRPILQMPLSEARDRIRKQIEKGQKLLELPIRNEAELKDARNERGKWSDYNAQLLRSIVDTDELINTYYPGVGFVALGPLPFHAKIEEFYSDVGKYIVRLESIFEYLELIPASPALAQRMRETSAEEEQAHLQRLLNIHRQNLYRLEERKARYGFNEPTSLQNEIEVEQAEIKKLEQELAVKKTQPLEDGGVEISPVSDSAVAMGPTVTPVPDFRSALSQELGGVREAIAELVSKFGTITMPQAAIASIFGDVDIQPEEDLCFVLMPFGDDILQQVYEVHIKPAVERVGLQCKRVDDMLGPAAIMEDIWKGINTARVVLAELTGQNPNVFYELGLCHAIGKDAILMAQDIKWVPFDVRHRRTIIYTPTPRGCKQLEEVLGETLEAMLGKVPAE